jgi:hypothetical protein
MDSISSSSPMRIPTWAVALVDEGENRNIAHPAHGKELPRLRLDALGRIDHHDGGIDCREHAKGVFRKILVTGVSTRLMM